MEKSAKFIIDVSAETKRIFDSSVRFFSKDHRTAKFLIQAEKDKVSIPKDFISRVEILFESVDISYTPTGKVIFNDDMTIEENGLFSYVLPDELLNYSGLMAFEVYIYYVNEDAADSSNRIIYEQRVSAIDRVAGQVELVYIKDMEAAKREITEQATEITENFLREWNAFEAGSTAKMQELEQRIDEQTEIFNKADVYNKAEIEDKLEPFVLQTDIAEVSAQLAQTNNDISFSANKVTYYAHRGAESHVPENTIKAFEVAHQLGFDGIELDTMCTADNEWVVMHDTTVDRMTDGTGTVNTMTLTEIQALTVNGGNFPIWHIGLKVPLLYDALVFAKNKGLKVLVEIKNSTTEQLVNLGNMISRLGMTETAIVLAPYGMANTLTSINSPLKLFVFYSSDSGFTTTLDNNRNIIGVSFNYPQITQPLIDEMHARGKLVNAWTIIRKDTAEMCSKMGVDSITGGVYNA